MTRRQILSCSAPSALVAAGCTVGPDYKRPEVSVPPAYRGADAGPPVASAAVVRRSRLVERLSGSGPPGADPHGAGAELRPARRGDAHSAGAEPGHDRPVAAVPDGGRQRQRPVRRLHGLATGPPRSRQQLPAAGRARRRVGAGLLGQVPAEHRGRAGRSARHRGSALRGHGDAGHPGRPGLPDSPGPGPHAGNLQAHRDLAASSPLDLVQARLDGGVAGMLDLRQAETLLYGATKTIPEIQRQIEQTENFISILLGQNPGPDQARAPARPADRGADAAAGPAVGPAHAAAGHPQGGAAAGFGERADRRRHGAALSAGHDLRICRSRRRDDQRLELRAVRDLQRAAGHHPADLQHGPPAGQRRLQRGRRPGSGPALPADAAAGVARSVGRAGRRSGSGRNSGSSRNCSSRRWRTPARSPSMRYEGGVSSYLEVLDTERQLLRRGARAGPGEARRVAERDRSSTRRLAADGRPTSRLPWLRPTEHGPLPDAGTLLDGGVRMAEERKRKTKERGEGQGEEATKARPRRQRRTSATLRHAGKELSTKDYDRELKKLHVELVKLQQWVVAQGPQGLHRLRGPRRRRQGRHDQGDHRAREPAGVSRRRAAGADRAREDRRCTGSATCRTSRPRARS